MGEKSHHSRTSRSRRAIALMAWGCLVGSAFFLWNARQTGSLRAATAEPIAFLLSAFAAFVGVFAWMLFNPNQSTSAESPSLFLAAAATLFPPPIIAFCLMPVGSPLKWWLALAVFLLVIIAILSHVPDEFFGVPRGRSSYVVPLPIFDRMENSILNPNSSWFTFSDLSRVVVDAERPSLAPNAYLNRETDRRMASPTRSTHGSPGNVDDILGTDYDIGLLDDSLIDYELSTANHGEGESLLDDEVASNTSWFNGATKTAHQNETSSLNPPESRQSEATSRQPRYATYHRNISHQHRLRKAQHRSKTDETSARSSRRGRHAESMQLQPGRSATLAGAASLIPDTKAAPAEKIHRSTEAGRNSRGTGVGERNRESNRDAGRNDFGGTSEESDSRPHHSESDTHGRQRSKPRSSSETVGRVTGGQIDQNRPGRTQPTAELKPDRKRVSQHEKRSQRKTDTSIKNQARTEETTSDLLFGLPIPVAPIQDAEPDVLPNEGFLERSDQDNPEVETPERQNESRQPETREQEKPRHSVTSPDSSSTHPQSTNRLSGTASTGKTEIQRMTDEHGSELVEGVMKIRFDKGQKRANLHVPFSPPLPGMPEVECECVDDVPLRLKVPVRQSYGIRIEARRTNAEKALETDVGFAAVFTPE